MYSTSAWSKVQALDAATGKLLWQYDPKVPAASACTRAATSSTAASRPGRARSIVGTLDGRLIALDAQDRQGGLVGRQTVDQAKPYTITGAPRVVKGKVIIGNGGAEYRRARLRHRLRRRRPAS